MSIPEIIRDVQRARRESEKAFKLRQEAFDKLWFILEDRGAEINIGSSVKEWRLEDLELTKGGTSFRVDLVAMPGKEHYILLIGFRSDTLSKLLVMEDSRSRRSIVADSTYQEFINIGRRLRKKTKRDSLASIGAHLPDTRELKQFFVVQKSVEAELKHFLAVVLLYLLLCYLVQMK